MNNNKKKNEEEFYALFNKCSVDIPLHAVYLYFELNYWPSI